MRKTRACLTPVDEEGIPCGDSISLTEGVDIARVGEGNLSICWPMGVPVSERYHVMVEMWTPEEQCGVIGPDTVYETWEHDARG
jgi:hypothetical protein